MSKMTFSPDSAPECVFLRKNAKKSAFFGRNLRKAIAKKAKKVYYIYTSTINGARIKANALNDMRKPFYA